MTGSRAIADAGEVHRLARPLGGPEDLSDLVHRIGSARVVMLGEASHGTHEFYRWRAELTRRLIEQGGAWFVAVEGDWPDSERVDASVRLAPGAPADPRAALIGYARWPTWMWANQEVSGFCRWLRDHNADLPEQERVGFHGLDVYSLWESLEAILLYLRERHPDQVQAALRAYRCFEPYRQDAVDYALATRFVPENCEADVIGLLAQARMRAAADGTAEFSTWQHAETVAEAERYYRAMVRGGPESWNVRDTHMIDTLDRLLDRYDDQSRDGARAVVWAHNTHVGDARATDMADAGMVNIGQLARQRYGTDEVVLIGFGGHHGSVVASTAWGAPARVMPVPPAREGTLEDLLHRAAPPVASFVFNVADRPRWLSRSLDHRAIGVVYHPERERWGNYVPTRLAERYDGFAWFDRTRALQPLHPFETKVAEPETYPTGV